MAMIAQGPVNFTEAQLRTTLTGVALADTLYVWGFGPGYEAWAVSKQATVTLAQWGGGFVWENGQVIGTRMKVT